MIITTPFQVRTEVQREPRNEVGLQSLTEWISGIQARNLPVLSATYYPTVSPFPNMYKKQFIIALLDSFQGIIGIFH